MPQWTVHDGQWQVLSSDADTKVVVAGRRWGKTDVLAKWAVKGAQDDRLSPDVENGRTWIVAPTYDLTQAAWRKCREIAPEGWVTNTYGSEQNPGSIELGDAVIEFKGAHRPKSLVSVGLRRLAVDECGTIKEETWTESLIPTRIDHEAPALLIGTPKGRNWFYREWLKGKDPEVESHAAFGGPTWENPFISHDTVRERASEMPEQKRRQEIEAEFLEDSGTVFRNIPEIVGEYSDRPTQILGVDLAKSVDFTVLIGLDSQGHVTHFDRFQKRSWPLQKNVIAATARRHNADLMVDSTGLGDPVVDDFRDRGLNATGFKFTSQSKQQLVESLAMAVEENQVTIPDEAQLVNELKAFDYEITPSGAMRYGAPEGVHDDCVMALALAWRGLRKTARTGGAELAPM